MFVIAGANAHHGPGAPPPGPFLLGQPDLRGVFLRGVNHGRSDPFADPDLANRTNLSIGGNTANNVGTSQGDALQNVKVTIGDFNNWGAFKGGFTAPFGATPNKFTSSGLSKAPKDDHSDQSWISPDF
jgi:hypothetical protein